MKELHQLLEKYLNEQLIHMVLSGPRHRESAARILIRPVLIKNNLVFQASEYQEKKVFHRNYSKGEAAVEIENRITEYRQLALSSQQGQATVLVSKKGRITIKEKQCPICAGAGAFQDGSGVSPKIKQVDLSHNRKKNHILEPEQKVDFLVDLGVQTKEGKIVKSRYDKFRQINRFLEFIEDILPQLPQDRELTILDFGCGKSYLTFAMYHYMKELKGYQVHIIGLDLKADVIETCSSLAEKYGYDRLEFHVGDIAGYEGVTDVDMVVTLHACDTATDYALDRAIRWGARVILSVPCCQHELNRQIQNDLLAPVLGYGLIKERMAALITDALRGQILESKGYQVQILEFIDMEHTPKNILIRAVKKGKAKDSRGYREVMEFLHTEPTLAVLQDGKEDKQNA